MSGLNAMDGVLCFKDLFDLDFGVLVDGFQNRKHPLTAKMHSGLSFSLSPVDEPKPKAARKALVVDVRDRHLDASEFGDEAVTRQVPFAVRAMEKGLPVVLLGDTGTGKEVMAKSLHQRSKAASGTLVAINCAAIPESLIEGELFGHAEGAYTGARRGGAPGKIEKADGGTLFLDEIGDMPLSLQSRLLRVLETRETTRLRSVTARSVRF